MFGDGYTSSCLLVVFITMETTVEKIWPQNAYEIGSTTFVSPGAMRYTGYSWFNFLLFLI